jgi:hypothetical protein
MSKWETSVLARRRIVNSLHANDVENEFGRAAARTVHFVTPDVWEESDGTLNDSPFDLAIADDRILRDLRSIEHRATDVATLVR